MPSHIDGNLELVSGVPEGDSSWGPDQNKNLDRLDALVQLAVEDRDLTTAPTSPADYARYIVAGLGGAWSSGFAIGQVAVWLPVEFEWRAYTPKEGWLCWVKDENRLLYHNGTSWVAATGYIWIPAPRWLGDGVTAVRGTAPNLLPVREFSGAADKADVVIEKLPDDFLSMTSASLVYVNEATNAATVQWRMGALGQLVSGGTGLGSLIFGTTLTQAPPTTADQIDIQTLSLPSMSGIAAGQIWKFAIQRLGAGDANNDTMGVVGFLLVYAQRR